MKTILLLTALMSTSAFSATLKIPLFIEENNNVVPASVINTKYKLQGADKLQEVLTVISGKASNANETFWAQREKVEQVAAKLNKDFFLATDRPGGFKSGSVQTCYTGTPADAVELAGEMSDSIYSDQMGIIGYKYKKQTVLVDSLDEEETLKYLNEESAVWANWNSTNDDILVLSHETDGGEDVNEGVLVKCK